MQNIKDAVLVVSSCLVLHSVYANAVNQEWFTVVAEGDEKLLQYLIASNTFNINSTNQRGNTALHEATRHNSPHIAKMLINAGADVNVRGEHGNTPLHIAARYGALDVIKELVKKGASTDAQNEGGDTPLMKAIRYHQWNAIIDLLRAGVDVNRKNLEGQTPLSLLENEQSAAALFVFKDLLRAGARPPESGTDEWNRLPEDKKALINHLRQRGKIVPQAVEDPALSYPSSRDTTQVITDFLGIPAQFLKH